MKTLLLLFLLFAITVNSQDNLWEEASKSHLKSKSKQIRPSKYKVYKLDLQLLKEELKKAPKQRENINLSTVVLRFPDENGVLKQYKITEASVMNVQLQENNPAIKSYIGKSIDSSNSIIRFSISPYTGFNGIVLNSATPPTIIERDGNYYQVFSEKDFPVEENPFKCGVVDQIESESNNNLPRNRAKTLIGSQLMTFRLALTTTGEYSQYVLDDLNIPSTVSDADKKAAILGHLNSVMTSVNAVFERDLAVTMRLVANNNNIIFLDAATDNLSNDLSSTIYGNNQGVCDNIIGNSNYDIGHLLILVPNTGISGVSSFSSVCSNGRKAKGSSGFYNNSEHSSKYYRILIHEMGHQFGAKHSFNIPSELNNNEESVEVKRGLTIMSYGGVGIDLFFHSISIAKIRNFIQSSNCASVINTGNIPPVANAGNDFTIPKLTPFLLEGTASDADNSTLTYTWEQTNPDKGIFPLVSYASQGPVFRWRPPTTEPKRYMPEINTILNGETENTLESVPSVSRILYFIFFVRDNDLMGGETDADQMAVTIDSGSGPFLITSHNSSPSTWYSGRTKTVSWDVANTDAGAVNTPTVDILFSTDGGMTYPTTLANNVANNGSHSFQIPFGIATTQGRFMIKANGNIFLDVNNADIVVEEKEFLVDIGDMEKEKSLCLTNSNSISYDFTYNSYQGFNGTVDFSASGLNGATITFSPASTNIDGDNITMTISNISITNIGTNIIPITATTTSSSSSFTNQVTLNVYDSSSLNAVSLTSPSNGKSNFLEPFTFQWSAENNADSYIIQISTDNGFSNIVDNATATSNSFVSTLLNHNTTYYWRVKGINTCLDGLFSNVFSFTTPSSAHANDTYIPDDIFEQVLINLGYDTGTLDDYVPTRNINAVTRLEISSLNIRDLTGIEAFVALDSLDCSSNPLTVLDVSSNTSLTYLSCPSINALDVSKNTRLSFLSFSGSGSFSELDLSKNTALTDLGFTFTELTSVDLSKNTELTRLNIKFNLSLVSLNLKNGNNTILTDFFSARNDFLRCIQVDNAVWSTDNWTRKDINSFFKENCTLGYNSFKTESFSISPNPVTNILYIENTNNTKVEQVKIFNILGKLIYDKRNKNNQIDFSNFSKAVYILKLTDKEGRYTIKKVLKQ